MAASLTVRRRPAAIDPPASPIAAVPDGTGTTAPPRSANAPEAGQPANAAETTSRASDCTCLRCSGPLNDSA